MTNIIKYNPEMKAIEAMYNLVNNIEEMESYFSEEYGISSSAVLISKKVEKYCMEEAYEYRKDVATFNNYYSLYQTMYDNKLTKFENLIQKKERVKREKRLRMKVITWLYETDTSFQKR